MAYTQKPGRGNGNPIMKLSDKLKGDSGLKLLGDLDKDGTLNKYEAKRQNAIESNSPATMYGAPIEMKANNGPMPQSGLNYGAPLKFHGKEHDSGDNLPSYDTTTYNANASASGSGSSSQNRSTSNLSDYQSTLVDKGSDFKPTQAQTDAANANVARLKALDRSNAEANATSNSNSSQSSSESTSTSTTTLGNQTLNQIKKSGNIQAQNRANKIIAVRQQARNQAVIDSTKVANKLINSRPVATQDNPAVIAQGQRLGNLAAKKSLLTSGAYTASNIRGMVQSGENYLGDE
jgi:hypothetical protein